MSSSRDLSSLIGVPGICLAMQHRFRHVFAARAPAEAGAEHEAMDVAFVGRQAGGRDGGGERRLAVLRPGPDLALLRRVDRGGVHRLEAGVVLVRIGVDRLDLLGRAGERGR